MNTLQTFIKSKPYGFLTNRDIETLIALDRLFPVLIRTSGCRLTCGAQYVVHIIQCLAKSGDWVRDVSLPVGSFERASDWQPEPAPQFKAEHPIERSSETAPDGLTFDGEASYSCPFDESQCGGVFDGRQVTSDADPGL